MEMIWREEEREARKRRKNKRERESKESNVDRRGIGREKG